MNVAHYHYSYRSNKREGGSIESQRKNSPNINIDSDIMNPKYSKELVGHVNSLNTHQEIKMMPPYNSEFKQLLQRTKNNTEIISNEMINKSSNYNPVHQGIQKVSYNNYQKRFFEPESKISNTDELFKENQLLKKQVDDLKKRIENLEKEAKVKDSKIKELEKKEPELRRNPIEMRHKSPLLLHQQSRNNTQRSYPSSKPPSSGILRQLQQQQQPQQHPHLQLLSNAHNSSAILALNHAYPTGIQRRHVIHEERKASSHNYIEDDERVSSCRVSYDEESIPYDGSDHHVHNNSPFSADLSLSQIQHHINPDNMTYEQLLQLEEKIGYVSKGLKPEQIKKISKSIYVKKIGVKDEECPICLSEFEDGYHLRNLPCSHKFHSHCIKKWLGSEKTCPICKKEVNV